MLDGDGHIVQHNLNSPYRESLERLKADEASDPMVHQVGGHSIDLESGCYWQGARYYCPEFGLWKGVDPLVWNGTYMSRKPDKNSFTTKSGFNLNSYMFGWLNPIKNSDPSGLEVYLAPNSVQRFIEDLRRHGATVDENKIVPHPSGYFRVMKDAVQFTGRRTDEAGQRMKAAIKNEGNILVRYGSPGRDATSTIKKGGNSKTVSTGNGALGVTGSPTQYENTPSSQDGGSLDLSTVNSVYNPSNGGKKENAIELDVLVLIDDTGNNGGLGRENTVPPSQKGDERSITLWHEVAGHAVGIIKPELKKSHSQFVDVIDNKLGAEILVPTYRVYETDAQGNDTEMHGTYPRTGKYLDDYQREWASYGN